MEICVWARPRAGHFDLDTSDFRHRSSVVEHTLGKGEVTGSSPVGGLAFEDAADGP